MKITDLTVNGVKDCQVLPVQGLRFSWKLQSEKNDVVQTAYRVQIRRETAPFGAGNASSSPYTHNDLPDSNYCSDSDVFFDSGVIFSDQSVEVVLPELKLDYESTYVLQVTVTDNKEESDTITSVIGTELSEEGWEDARWIRPKKSISGWAPYLRCKFVTEEKPIRSAALYGCALGIGEFYLNGQRTDDALLDPPQTDYTKRILYRKQNVTSLIQPGGNALAVLIGEGFYAQSRIWTIKGFRYGQECALAKLVVTYEDGTRQTIVTNPSTWKSKLSPYTVNNIYAGETYDCRLETPDFSLFDGEEEGWEPVVEDETPKGTLEGCLMPPIRVLRELPCKDVWASSGASDAAWIFDLGENFAGTYEVRIPPSPVGHVYVFRCAEAINPQGDLDHRSSGGFATQCIQQEIYITRGDAKGEIYRPKLTYHGFRYVEITGINDISEGYGTMPKKEMIKGLQLTTDFAETAAFTSSSSDLNHMMSLMKNTYRSNFHGLPEDCPAREKCGWLGDAQIVANFGLLTYDSKASYEKYLADIRTTREVYGTWQMIAPGKRGCGEASPLWGCAQILIPYYLWKYDGDCSVIEENIDLMRAWVQHELARSKDYLISEGLGDWDPAGGNENPGRMPVLHSSTFMFYEICQKMQEIAEAFSYEEDTCNAEYYADLGRKIKDSILRNLYDHKNHTYGYWGSNGVALELGLYPDDPKPVTDSSAIQISHQISIPASLQASRQALKTKEYSSERNDLLRSTVQLMEKDHFAMPTGIYGNKYLVSALLDAGLGDLAMKFLFNREEPSFGTMMDDQATTIWEVPDMKFIQPDHSVSVSSYDHPMHGGFLYTCYTKLAGIEPLEPGFKVIGITPVHLDSLDQLSCSLETPYGKVSVSYELKSGAGRMYQYRITVPANTNALFREKDGTIHELGSGSYVF